MMVPATPAAWEAMWAPYDEPTYLEALAHIPFGAVVLDIGAGDMRFARLAAGRVAFVYAIERRPELVAAALASGLPENVSVTCGDARVLPFPGEVDTAVLLMRHCTEFRLYLQKLVAVGCRYLITNARWGMGVERIDLRQPPLPFGALSCGWYACRCGATGFREGPAAAVTARHVEAVAEVVDCPACAAQPGE